MVALCSNIKCDYIKIVNGDYCPECGAKTSDYGFLEGRSWIQDKKKYKKMHKTVEKSSKCGVLVCDKCGGYYELQSGESPEDFDLTCDCGGNIFLTTINDVIGEKFLVDLPYCPSCGAAKPKGNFCETCGNSLDGTQSELDNSFFIEGPFNKGAKISTESIIIHKKNLTGRRTDETEYPMSLIEKVNLSKSMTGYDLKFKYKGEYKNVDVPTSKGNPTIEEVGEFFKNLSIPTSITTNKPNQKRIKRGICPNINCLNKDYMEIDSKCPECGTIVRTAGWSETMKIMGGKDKVGRDIKNKAKFERDRAKIKQKWVEYADEKRKYIADKKRKYRCLKVARGNSSRLELYDNSIKLYYYGSLSKSTQKQVYAIEDIISIDFIEANRYGGSINFNIRGLNPTPNKSGGMIFYGPNTGFMLGIGSTGSSDPPITGISFKGKWEPEFREIKEIIEAKILENKGMVSTNDKSSLEDLEKLAELKNKGIITEEEFDAKKKTRF